MSDVTIRPARASDLEAIARLELTGEIHWSGDSLRQALEPPYLMYVGEAADAGISAFIIGLLAADELEIANIVVAPQCRKSGHGGRLLSILLEEAMRRGARNCFLEVAEGNFAAQALYVSLGFSQIGIRKGYYTSGENALLMSRKI